MKLIRPGTGNQSNPNPRSRRNLDSNTVYSFSQKPGQPIRAYPHKSKWNPPDWLKEWIDSKPRYVLLACGHKDNRALRNTLIIKGIAGAFDGCEMFCNKCQSFQLIVRPLKFNEYHGIQLPIETDEPPF